MWRVTPGAFGSYTKNVVSAGCSPRSTPNATTWWFAKGSGESPTRPRMTGRPLSNRRVARSTSAPRRAPRGGCSVPSHRATVHSRTNRGSECRSVSACRRRSSERIASFCSAEVGTGLPDSNRSMAASAIPPQRPNVRHRLAMRCTSASPPPAAASAPVATALAGAFPNSLPPAPPSAASAATESGRSHRARWSRSASVHAKEFANENPSRAGSKGRTMRRLEAKGGDVRAGTMGRSGNGGESGGQCILHVKPRLGSLPLGPRFPLWRLVSPASPGGPS